MKNKFNKNKSTGTFLAEWFLIKKEWFYIYNWDSLSRKGYSEEIAKLLLDKFKEVKINYTGLRKNNFCVSSHLGQCKLSTPISQHVEKRFCRALFNKKDIPFLGKILDYEIPFKEKAGAKHGDIDLISYKDAKLFIIEAKKIGSSESILKAILEAYVYSNLVNAVKKDFYADFKIKPKTKIAPVVLTFKDSTSGEQLINIVKHPNIKKLIKKLDKNLMSAGMEKIRFFLITNTKEEIKDSLKTKPFDKKCKMIVFKNNFNLSYKELEY